jgi:hypothetical protein
MKTTVNIELNGNEKIDKISFIKTWINDENIRIYQTLVFTHPPLIHDGRDYNTWSGFDNDNKPIQLNFNPETNEYVLLFKEYIHNLLQVGCSENYVCYILAWIANIIQYPAFSTNVCIIFIHWLKGWISHY